MQLHETQMSQKHKRRVENDKHLSSRVNVFERLGDSKKDRTKWPVHSTHSHKNNRSNVDRYEGNHGGRIVPDRWNSSGRERALPQTSPTKLMKSKRIDMAYKQDRRRYEEDMHPVKHHHHVEALAPKHHRLSVEAVPDDLERKRKRKPVSPASVSGSSVSPLRAKRDTKRSKYQSPSPPPQVHKDKEQRGRSKERKSKKVKEVVNTKELPKPSKATKSYDQYPEMSEYKSAERQYKTAREDAYEIEAVKYRKDVYVEHHKEKKRVPESSLSPMKKSRAAQRDIESSENEERRKYRDTSGKSSHYRQAVKSDPVYESDDVISHHKKSKSKMDPILIEEPKRKKKVKPEREERDIHYSSKGSSGEYAPREKVKKPKEEIYYDDVRTSQQTSTKQRSAKYSASDVDVMEERERKSKLKKKKKQIIKVVEEIPEPIKKKKSKQKVIEEPTKKKSSKVYEEEIRDKQKSIKKKKRPREPTSSPSSSSSSSSGSSSESESESDEDVHIKKHQSSTRESWEAGTVPDVSPERSYSKRSSYASGKDGSISAEVEPKRKRAKIEMGRREASEAESAGRYRRESPDRNQYSKRREDRSFDRPSYPAYEKESKRLRDDGSRDDRRVHSSDAPQKRHIERHLDYIHPKEELPLARYDRSPAPDDARYTKRHPDDKFYDKNYSRYNEKLPNTYDEKQNYTRRDQGFHEKKAHYDDRRDNRGDSYPVEERKRDPYPSPHVPQHAHHKASGYTHEPRSGDMRNLNEPRHQNWPMERAKKYKDPAPGYSGGIQRTSSWGDGRESSKQRVEASGHRGNQLPTRVEERSYRMPRNDNRPSRKEVVEVRRPESRERHQIRDPIRKQPQEKWVLERHPYDNAEVRRGGGGRRYNDDRNRSQEDPHYSAEGASPSFFREVRRSGESHHNDLKIEVTIGGRSGSNYDKNRAVKRSPPRKVSSYEVSKRDRIDGKVQPERNNSRDRGTAENMLRYKRPMSHHKQGSTKYQQHNSREFPSQSRDYSDNRDYSRGHVDTKTQDITKFRKKEEKYYKKESSRTESDRSRDSSAVERVRSRDSSVLGRDRSRDKSQQSSRDRSRRDAAHSERSEHSSRKSRSNKETANDSYDRRRRRADARDRKSKDEKNTDKEEKAKKDVAPEAAGVLDIDWTEISSEKKVTSQLDEDSILNRFRPGSVLLRMGVSSKLLPPDLLDEVKKICEEAPSGDDPPLVLNQELGALNRSEALSQWSWSNAFTSKTSRLTSYADAEHRQKILSINQDMLFPPQPPMIINAKTYASSIKHYLNKTKLTVGGA